MEKIKEQFGEITKSIRTKNNLTQKDMASKLYLNDQTIYAYEKAKRMMKLLEFIEFIQKFDESVLINKDGISLINTDLAIKNDKKESKRMSVELNNLKLIEEKGDVSFYEEIESKKQYQKVEGIGSTPILVVEGNIEYQTVKNFGDIFIKYNTNGCYGYSIWVNDRCYEDNFWVLKQAEDAVNEMFLLSQKNKTVSVMVANFKNRIEDEKISLEEFDLSDSLSFVSSMDNVFLDGGEFRCEGFMDIAIPYALNFGELESDTFYDALWECVDETFKKIKEESEKTIFCKKSKYNLSEIKFSSFKNDDDSYTVTLEKDGKKLTFTEFHFGLDTPNLDTVMDSVKDDYILFKTSPTLSDYIDNRGMIEDTELEYKILKSDVKSIIKFFGKKFLNDLISE